MESKLHEAPLGSPGHASEMGAEKPSIDVTLQATEPVAPGGTATILEPHARSKVGC